MSVFLYSPRAVANVLRFLAARDTSDDLYFACMRHAAQQGLCTEGTFGDATYDRIIMDPRFPVHLASEDAIGLGKAMLANLRAYNSAAVNARTPRDTTPEETADHYAREVLLCALRQGTKVDTKDAVDTVNLLHYNTVDNGGKEHAPDVEGCADYLAEMTRRAFGLLAEMWRRGETDAN